MSLLARLSLAAAALASTAADGPFLDESPEPARPEVLFFMASWCGPCQTMQPLVDRLTQEGFPLRSIDVDRERSVATEHKITGIPAFVALANGREVGRLVGHQSESSLRTLFQRVSSPTRTFVTAPDARSPEVPGATKVEPLLRVTYPVPKAKAEALVAFLKANSEVEFESDIADDALRLTATPEVQHSLGPFLRDVLTFETPDTTAVPNQ